MNKFTKKRLEELNEEFEQQARLIKEAREKYADWDAYDRHYAEYDKLTDTWKKIEGERKVKVGNVISVAKILADLTGVGMVGFSILKCANAATAAEAGSVLVNQRVWNLGLEGFKMLFRAKK